jgi:hypothetical protein
VEYGLLAALIAVVMIASVSQVGTRLWAYTFLPVAMVGVDGPPPLALLEQGWDELNGDNELMDEAEYIVAREILRPERYPGHYADEFIIYDDDSNGDIDYAEWLDQANGP